MQGDRVHIAAGSNVDCGYFPDGKEWFRGFLRLPAMSAAGELRFVEDVPGLARLPEELEYFNPIPIRLLDATDGTVGALIGSFPTQWRVQSPTPPPYPLKLLVNSVLLGSDDPAARYSTATLQSKELVDALGAMNIGLGALEVHLPNVAYHASARTDDMTLDVKERVAVEADRTKLTAEWLGELTLHGPERTVDEWSDALKLFLHLFALLTDRPLGIHRLFAEWDRPVDFYAQWPTPSAPVRTDPLLRLDQLAGGELARIVGEWARVAAHWDELMYVFVEAQYRRNAYLTSDLLLLLSRGIELYHGCSGHFESTRRTKADHKAIVDSVVASLPAAQVDNHEWIADALKAANRKRLVVQIEDVLAFLGGDVRKACRVENAAEFARAVKTSRNYFTHRSGRRPGVVADPRSLVVQNNRLWFVLRACLLIELGFDRASVSAMLERNASASYLLA